MTSFNHYALGAVADWLHRTVGGLAPGRAGLSAARHPRRGPGGGLTPRRGRARDAVRARRVRWARTRRPARGRGARSARHDGARRAARRRRAPVEVGPGTHRFAIPFRAPEEDEQAVVARGVSACELSGVDAARFDDRVDTAPAARAVEAGEAAVGGHARSIVPARARGGWRRGGHDADRHELAGKYAYRARVLHRPASLGRGAADRGAAPRVRVLGSRHSFTDIADSAELVSLDALPGGRRGRPRGRPRVVLAAACATASSSPRCEPRGWRCKPRLAPAHRRGRRVATATHGSGDRSGNLATAVAGSSS